MEFDDRKSRPSSNRALLFQQVQEQSDICDVTIQVGQWRKKFHWCVLVMSPFFESVRRNNFIEKQTGVVKLTIATPLNTETTILFLYGKKPKLTEENTVSILELSEFLLIPNLKSACVSFLKTVPITDENCMKMLDMSSLYDFEFSKCYDFIRGHLHEILPREDANRLTKESVIMLLSDPLLSYVTAEEKFTYAVRWANEFKQNKAAFPDVFMAIDLENINGEFLETVVLQHPLVADVRSNNSQTMITRNTPQEHRVFIFPDFMKDNRIACFDFDSEKWCGIEAGLPEDLTFRNNFGQYSIEGVGESSEIYRVENRYDVCRICIQDLHSKLANVSKVLVPEDNERKIRFSTYSMDGETFVAVSNDRTKRNRPCEQPQMHPGDLIRLGLLEQVDPISQLVIARYIGSQMIRGVYIDSSTVFCGQLQYPETKLSSVVTMLDADITSACINANKLFALHSRKNNKLYIYDAPNCLLDTISLECHLDSETKYTQTKLAAKEDGFVLYNTKSALSICRIHGTTLSERYKVQKVDLEVNREWHTIKYFFGNETWFRFLKRKWDCEVEFSCLSHEDLMNGKAQELAWRQLPCPKDLDGVSRGEKMFMIKLPRSMLNCHFNCPHCKQQKQQQVVASIKSYEIDDDYMYEDSDDDSYGDISYGYGGYYDDYYYSSD